MRFTKALVLLLISFFTISCAITKPPRSHTEDTAVHHQNFNEMLSKKAYIDARFNDDEREAISRAAAAWEHDTNGIIHFDLIWGFDLKDTNSNASPSKYTNKFIIKKLLSTDKLTEELDKSYANQVHDPNAQLLGLTIKHPPFEIVYIIADRLTNGENFVVMPLYQNVVMHELGHDLGMKHFDEGGSIMNSEYEMIERSYVGIDRTPLTCLTEHDAYQFCSIYHCNFASLNHC